MSHPIALGPRRSFGFGDRFGFAGRAALAAARGSGFAPVFAQQSARELAETGRSPGDVLHAVPPSGDLWGADADAIANAEEARAFASAGFTRLTIDPSAYFVEKADAFSADDLDAAAQALVDDRVFPPEWLALFPRQEVPITNSLVLRFGDDDLRRVAVKFGWALAYAGELVAHASATALEVEFSAAAASTPTSPLEHWFIARECRRRGLPLAAFAPRLPGSWEIGTDYEDDANELEQSLATHAAIAGACGPHQVSIQEIEEKHAILPRIGRVCGERLHAKTSAASALAALRVVARTAPAIFREILVLAQELFPFTRPGRRVSLTEDEIRFLPDVSDDALESAFLDDWRGRQLLDTTIGSIWGSGRCADGEPMRSRLASVLTIHGALHDDLLEGEYRRLLAALDRG